MSTNWDDGALIAVDWGTSNLRAALLDAGGAVIDRVDSDRGILRLARGDFPTTFETLLGPWLSHLPEVAVIMAGMVGSANGWLQAPYLPCPVDLEQLAKHRTRIPDLGREVSIVPGLSGRSIAGNHDVMRGEEVQIIGALQAKAVDGAGVFCLPGTHSKWVAIDGATVAGFSTSMTGDLYAALRDHSILGRGGDGDEHDSAAFESGVAQATRPGGLLHHLFSVRSEALLGDLAAGAALSYLSGVLIGHEVAAMRRVLEDKPHPVTLIGGRALNRLYTQALGYFGFAARGVDGSEAAWRGLHRLASAAAC